MARNACALALVSLLIACVEPAQGPGPTVPVLMTPPTPASHMAPPGPAATAAPAPIGGAPSRVETATFSSAALGVDKHVVVYLPRGYDDSQHRFPTVYMLHGLSGNETNWTSVGHLKETADAAALEAVVIMPDGDDGFYTNWASPSSYEECLKRKPPFDGSEKPETYCVRTPSYEDYIARDLVSWVDATYRTRAAREARVIGGLSMGGFGALSLAMRHPDLWSAAASHSGMDVLLYNGVRPYAPGKGALASSLSGWGAAYPSKFRDHVKRVFGADIEAWRAHDPGALAAKLDPEATDVYLDCGTEDDFHFDDHARYLHDALDARGVAHAFALVPGAHTWTVWRARLPESLRFFAAHFARKGVN